MGNADLLRPLLCGQEQSRSAKLDELRSGLTDVERQANKLAKLIPGDDKPSPMIYSHLRQEGACAKSLRAEIERASGNKVASAPTSPHWWPSTSLM